MKPQLNLLSVSQISGQEENSGLFSISVLLNMGWALFSAIKSPNISSAS